MKTLLKDAEKLQTELVKHRRYLHQHAEVGFDLPQTCAYVEKILQGLGYAPERCGKAGLVATVGDPKNKPVILLRADMDGLPLQEESKEEFMCTAGHMHACGHDLHTAMLLGASALLKKREDALNGCVKLFFQSAEEILEGAKEGLKNGILEAPAPDCAVMVHVTADSPFATGTAIVASAGMSAPAADFFQITIQGKGCHGSAPWNGVDALSVGAYITLALQTLSAREISVSAPAVLTVGSMQAGNAGNVIADSAILKGTLRAFDEETRTALKARIKEIAQAQATAFRATVKTEFLGGCPTLVNDEEISLFAYEMLCGAFGKERVYTSAELQGGNVAKQNGGSEDFAYISHEVPSVMVALAAGERAKGYSFPLHHPKVRFDEEALYVGAAIYAGLAWSWLNKKN
ncbi:MAG: amidohydrolase [Clostridia bacterium]|nr:amidohydrolase [Clostridia bacterium]